MIQIANIIFYSTHCPKCNILKQKLDEKNINYIECNDTDLMLEKGFRSAPMLEVDGNIMDYFEAIKWVKEIWY